MHADTREPLAARLSPSHWLALDVTAAAVYSAFALGLFVHKVSPAPLAVAVCVLMSVPIVLARRQPIVALAAAMVLFWLNPASTTAGFVALLPASWALYCSAVRNTGWTAVALLAVALTGPIATAVPIGSGTGAVIPFALVLLTSWAFGRAVGQARRYNDEVLSRHRLRAETEAERARVAVTDERLRIARDMHDVLAHGMSVITVQAAYAGVMLEARDGPARDAVAAIEETGRQTLVDLRRLVGILRTDDRAANAPLAPAPGLADLQRLVTAAALAGVEVDLMTTGEPRQLSPALELAAYRILQEALTNVAKHSASAAAVVRVDYARAELVVRVTDDGVGSSAPPEQAEGHGIAGMRERVGLYGGSLDAGPRPGGGYQVIARLPLPGTQ